MSFQLSPGLRWRALLRKAELPISNADIRSSMTSNADLTTHGTRPLVGAQPRQSSTVQRWLLHVDAQLVSRLVLLVLTALVFKTFRDYGVSWDEHVQNTYGHRLLSYYLSGFRDQSAFHLSNLRYYGGAFDLIAAILNTVSPFGEYETRHLLGGVVGVVGAIGVWRLARLLAGERAGFFALALTALTPLIYGHSFINPKDAPFASALVWSIYYICRTIMELPRPRRATVFGLGVALGLALGTRVVAVIVLLYGVPAFFAYSLGRYRECRDARVVGRELVNLLATLLPAVPCVLALAAVFWPWVAKSPGNLDTAVRLFSHFPWHGKVLFNGQLFKAAHLPATYLAKLIALQMPEVVLLGLLAAAGFGIRAAFEGGWRSLTDPRSLCYSVLLAAVLVPLLHFIVARPLVYNGIRHYLFMIPPLIVLAGIGMDRAYSWVRSHGVWPARGFAALFAVAAGVQIAIMVELHPDEYIYYNVFAGGVSGAAGRYDLDYWGLSLAEATRDLERVVAREQPKADGQPWRVYVCGDRMSAAYFFAPGLHYTQDIGDADYAVAIRSGQCGDEIKGPVLLEVKRGGAVLSYAADLRGKSD